MRSSRLRSIERLGRRDQQAFLAADTPEKFLADLTRFAETGE
jgi:hypothetical protein